MKKTLFIINGFYPYEKSEDYLSAETQYINGFDLIYCFPVIVYGKRDKSDIHHYQYNDKIKYCNSRIDPSKCNILILSFYIIKLLSMSFFIKEIIHVINGKKFLISRLKSLFKTGIRAIHSYYDIKRIIVNDNLNDTLIYIYSYWAHRTALTGLLLKNDKYLNVKTCFTRCHRFDIYEYATDNLYIPFRKYIYENMDKLFVISEDAKLYINSKYSTFTNEKIVISRLGTFDHGFRIPSKRSVLKIVSCSWLRPVKRVNLIFEALKDIDIQISWTHYGSGEEFDNIKSLILNNNNPNLTVNLFGNVSNNELMKEYNKMNYNIFINVSSSEGVPVSIMEAMSFAMPVIATNVGGTCEIVKEGVNGFILPINFDVEILKKYIYIISEMNDDDYSKMALSSRKIWEHLSNAETNYNDFYNNIKSI